MGNLSADKFEGVLKGRMLLHRFKSVLDEYNHYHGKGGRFASGGAGGGGAYVPGKGEKKEAPVKEEAAEGVLSKDEMKEIDKIADGISLKSTGADMDKALEDSVKKVGLGQKEADYAKSNMLGVTASSQGSDGARVTMALNKTAGANPRANMSPDMLKAAKDPRVKTPTKDQVKAVATAQALNQAVLRKEYGTHVTVYRGVSGQYSQNIKATGASAGSKVDINVRSLSSWTTSQETAAMFGGKGASLLKARVPISRVALSHRASSALKGYGESEFLLHSSKGSLGATVVY